LGYRFDTHYIYIYEQKVLTKLLQFDASLYQSKLNIYVLYLFEPLNSASVFVFYFISNA